MKVKCIHYAEVQDKYDNSVFYYPNESYDVTAERGEELIASGYFVAVKSEWAVTNEEDGVHVRPVVDGEIIDTPIEEVIEPVEEEKPKRTRKSAK